MPVHDWTRVRSNRFHDFHQSWTVAIRNVLNTGRFPPGYFAMVEQQTGGPEPDVVTLELKPPAGSAAPAELAVELQPPKTRIVTRSEAAGYARKANRITVRHPDGDVVAVLEIVSPGNKDSRHALRSFVRKAVAFLHAGIHLLIVDLFPPGPPRPAGHSQGDLGPHPRRAVYAAAGQAADRGGLRGRDRVGRLRRAGRGRRRFA